MYRSFNKLRLRVAGGIAMSLFALRALWHRILRRPIESMPNYTLIEPGLYLGGISPGPPPDARAVLCVTPARDSYSAEIYEWQPIHPGAAVTVDWIGRQVRLIDGWRKAGHTVFVHCDAGFDRSAMVVAAYLMWRDGRGRDDMIDGIQRKRAHVHLSPLFLKLLAEWESAVS